MDNYKKSWGHVVAERYAALRELSGPFLDVGCSTGGYISSLLDDGEIVHGFDLNAKDEWSANPGKFSLGSAEQIAFSDNSFETVYSFEVLEHLNRYRNALLEMKRVSRSNILISVPNCDVPIEFRNSGITFNHFSDPTHVNFFTRDSLAALFDEVDLDLVYIKYINRIKPELLFFEMAGLPNFLVRNLSRLSRYNPRAKTYHMTLLALARKRSTVKKISKEY